MAISEEYAKERSLKRVIKIASGLFKNKQMRPKRSKK